MKLPEELELEPRSWTDAPAAVPEGGHVVWRKMRDGAKIRIGFWERPGARGTVLVLPGRTEFIEKYGETIGELLSRGFSVMAIDWRGQGLSTRPLANRLKGHIDQFETYVEDFREVMDWARNQLTAPYFMLCHSMGGNIGVRILLEDIGPISGAVFTAPMLGLKTAGLPPPAVHGLARSLTAVGLGGTYIPGGRDTSVIDEVFDGNIVTNDVIRFGRNKKYVLDEPDLALGPPTIGWLNAALRSIGIISPPNVAEGLLVPALFFIAGEEALADNEMIKRFAGRMKRAKLVEYEKAKHEILQERDEIQVKFWVEFDQFTDELLGSSACA